MPVFRSPAAAGIYGALNSRAIFTEQTLPSNGLGLLVLHVSEGCNLGCSYCFADKGQYGAKSAKWMTSETGRRAIDFVFHKYGGLNAVKFFGGEPLLRIETVAEISEYVNERCDALSAKRPQLVAISNLTRCDEPVVQWVQKFKPSITASIDGPKEVHDLFRIYPDGKGSFDAVDQNIKKLYQLTGQPNTLECVYSPAHFSRGLSMVDVHKLLLERYSIEQIIIHPLQGDSGCGGDDASKAAMEHYREDIYRQSVEYGEYLMLHTLMHGDQMSINAQLSRVVAKEQTADAHCGLGVQTLTVQANGDLVPCYTLIGQSGFEMGNVFAEEGESFRSVERLFLNNRKSENAVCSSCAIVKTCHSCPGDMLLSHGSISAPVATTCNYLTGMVEGRVLGLNAFRMTEDWKRVFPHSDRVDNTVSQG